MQRRIYRGNRLPIERANKYLQTTHKTVRISTIGKNCKVKEHLCTYGDRNFHMFPFFKILQEYKSQRKSYKDYFIDKFRPLLNKKT